MDNIVCVFCQCFYPLHLHTDVRAYHVHRLMHVSVYINAHIRAVSLSGAALCGHTAVIKPVSAVGRQAVAKCCRECVSAFLEVEFAGSKCVDTFNARPIL